MRWKNRSYDRMLLLFPLSLIYLNTLMLFHGLLFFTFREVLKFPSCFVVGNKKLVEKSFHSTLNFCLIEMICKIFLLFNFLPDPWVKTRTFVLNWEKVSGEIRRGKILLYLSFGLTRTNVRQMVTLKNWQYFSGYYHLFLWYMTELLS